MFQPDAHIPVEGHRHQKILQSLISFYHEQIYKLFYLLTLSTPKSLIYLMVSLVIMSEKSDNVFRSITYNAVMKVVDAMKDELNEIYPDDKYRDVWMDALSDGIGDLSNILLGELYKGKDTTIKELYNQVEEEVKSKYSDKKRILLNSLLSVLAITSDENFEVSSLVNVDAKEKRKVDVAYM